MIFNKKLLTLLIAALAMSLTACGADEESNEGDCSGGFVSEDCPEDDANNDDDQDDDDDDDNDDDDDDDDDDVNNDEEPPEDPYADCQYPEGAPAKPTYGEVMPEIHWEGAYLGDGSRVDFGLKELYCDSKYDNIETIVFVVGSGWCPNCPAYAQYVTEIYDRLAAEGVFLIWFEAENRNFEPSTHDEIQESMTRYIGPGGPGIRVGDAETLPTPQVLRNNPLIQAFPSQFIVRKRDMKIIGASVNETTFLPLMQYARYPEADWDAPGVNTNPESIGNFCQVDADCDTNTLPPYCFEARDANNEFTGWAGGYCIALNCADDAACGEGNVCVPLGEDGTTGCFKGCTNDTEETDCRAGYRCGPVAGVFGPKACIPR